MQINSNAIIIDCLAIGYERESSFQAVTSPLVSMPSSSSKGPLN